MSGVDIERRGRLLEAKPHDESAMRAIRGMLSSRFDHRSGRWVVPATPSGAVDLAEALAGHEATVDAETRELAAQARRGREAARWKGEGKPPPIPGLKIESWDHQSRGFWFAAENPASMLAMDMGTGKSLVVVGLAEYDKAQRVLVVCPRNCLGVWLREFRDYAEREWEIQNGRVPKRGGGWLKGATVSRKASQARAALEAAEITGRPVEVVTNYEAFTQPAMQALIRETSWDLIVFDESHRLQDPGGKWSKFAATLDAPRKICCTGTPFGQTPLTAYGQYRFLDPAIYGTDYALFKARYAVTREIELQTKRGARKQEIIVGVRKDMEQDFMQRFERIAYVCKSEDVQDLPEFVPQIRDVELEAKTRKIYDELDAEFIAWARGDLEGDPITASNALVKSVRLRQIVNGYANNEAGHMEAISDEKAKALRELLTDVPTDEPVVVFCQFVPDLDKIRAIAEESGRRYGELSGRRKDALNEDAKMRDDVDLAAVQLQSGGVGIDLTRARIGIYYSLCESLVQYQQSRKRLDRPGQTRAGVLIHLLTDTPIERKVYNALRRNEQVNEALLRAAIEDWQSEETEQS